MVLWWCTVKFVNKGKHCLNHERLLCQDVVCTSIIVIGKLDFGYTLYSPFLSEGVYQNLSTNVSACLCRIGYIFTLRKKYFGSICAKLGILSLSGANLGVF